MCAFPVDVLVTTVNITALKDLLLELEIEGG